MAGACTRKLTSEGVSAALLDLRDYPLPLCDGAAAYGDPNVAALAERIAAADGVLIAMAVYNYGPNAAAKNLLELTGKSWTGKIIGFMCAAGGDASYMSVMPFAGSFILDYRCVMIPRFVYASGKAFGESGIIDPGVDERIGRLARDMVAFTGALRGLTEPAS